MVKKILAKTYIWLILIFMYLPILLLIAYSFTDTTFIGQWSTFSFDVYAKLFKDTALLEALKNTIIVAVVSALIATILGATGAIGAFYLGRKSKKFIEGTTQVQIANAEIVIAFSLAILFVTITNVINAIPGVNHVDSILGWGTLIVGHVVLTIPFVFISVKPKLEQMDPSLYEAALDLGCTPSKALFKVIIPDILPGIFSGFMLSITLSLDDFIITKYTSGSKVDTLSTFIQDKLAKGTPPNDLRALTAFIFLIVVLAVIAISIYKDKKRTTASRHRKLTRNQEGVRGL